MVNPNTNRCSLEAWRQNASTCKREILASEFSNVRAVGNVGALPGLNTDYYMAFSAANGARKCVNHRRLFVLD